MASCHMQQHLEAPSALARAMRMRGREELCLRASVSLSGQREEDSKWKKRRCCHAVQRQMRPSSPAVTTVAVCPPREARRHAR